MTAQIDSTKASQGFKLGTAQTIITPPVGGALVGFVARTEGIAGVHDDLYARAMVWSDGSGSPLAALLTLDVIGLDLSVVEKIRQHITSRTAIPGEQIAITTTHTHGGPAVMEGRLGGHVDLAYLDELIQKAARTVVAASEALEPVTARFSIGQEATVGKNRRVPEGPVDAEVPVLRFDGMDGRVKALLVSYACHPVTLGAENLLITADYPGYVIQTLETLYPGALVMFATGCCGQINTGHAAKDSVNGRGLERRTYAESQRLGRIVAAAALQATEQGAVPGGMPLAMVADAASVKVVRSVIELPLLPIDAPDTMRQNAVSWREDAQRLQSEGASKGEVLLLYAWADWAESMASASQLSQSVRAEIMVFALGPISIVTLPGEAFVEFGLEIKQRANHPALMVLAYGNGNQGYIPHRSAYEQGGYEVFEAYRFYNYPAGFAPEAGEMIVEEALRLIRSVSGNLL